MPQGASHNEGRNIWSHKAGSPEGNKGWVPEGRAPRRFHQGVNMGIPQVWSPKRCTPRGFSKRASPEGVLQTGHTGGSPNGSLRGGPLGVDPVRGPPGVPGWFPKGVTFGCPEEGSRKGGPPQGVPQWWYPTDGHLRVVPRGCPLRAVPESGSTSEVPEGGSHKGGSKTRIRKGGPLYG